MYHIYLKYSEVFICTILEDYLACIKLCLYLYYSCPVLFPALPKAAFLALLPGRYFSEMLSQASHSKLNAPMGPLLKSWDLKTARDPKDRQLPSSPGRGVRVPVPVGLKDQMT